MPFDAEDLGYMPAGGRLKLILLGVLLPGIIVWYGSQSWVHELAWWPARQGRDLVVRGEAAQAMAVVYCSVALFIHARWFWGLLQWERTFTAGTVMACLLFLGALLWAFCVV